MRPYPAQKNTINYRFDDVRTADGSSVTTDPNVESPQFAIANVRWATFEMAAFGFLVCAFEFLLGRHVPTVAIDIDGSSVPA